MILQATKKATSFPAAFPAQTFQKSDVTIIKDGKLQVNS